MDLLRFRTVIVSDSYPAYLKGPEYITVFGAVIISVQAVSYNFNMWMLNVVHSCNCKSI